MIRISNFDHGYLDFIEREKSEESYLIGDISLGDHVICMYREDEFIIIKKAIYNTLDSHLCSFKRLDPFHEVVVEKSIVTYYRKMYKDLNHLCDCLSTLVNTV